MSPKSACKTSDQPRSQSVGLGGHWASNLSSSCPTSSPGRIPFINHLCLWLSTYPCPGSCLGIQEPGNLGKHQVDEAVMFPTPWHFLLNLCFPSFLCFLHSRVLRHIELASQVLGTQAPAMAAPMLRPQGTCGAMPHWQHTPEQRLGLRQGSQDGDAFVAPSIIVSAETVMSVVTAMTVPAKMVASPC